MIANVKATASQVTPAVTGEGNMGFPKMTKLGALFTADWKHQLTVAGLVWSAHVGGITTSGDIVSVVGGGNGTTIDTDQPELTIGVPAGYYMIPVEAHCAVYNDPIGDNAITNIVLFADRTMSPVEAAISATVVTPVNLLDGGAAFPGTAYKACTANLTTAPVCSEILDYKGNQLGTTTGGSSILQLAMDYLPDAPSILAGPCQVVMCWGGVSATNGMGVIKVAVVPVSYFPTS